MEKTKDTIVVIVSIDRQLLNQKLNKILSLKEELDRELNSISGLFKISN